VTDSRAPAAAGTSLGRTAIVLFWRTRFISESRVTNALRLARDRVLAQARLAPGFWLLASGSSLLASGCPSPAASRQPPVSYSSAEITK